MIQFRPQPVLSEDRSIKQDMGDCYFCKQPVWANLGQFITYTKIEGQPIPTHKKCRKENT